LTAQGTQINTASLADTSARAGAVDTASRGQDPVGASFDSLFQLARTLPDSSVRPSTTANWVQDFDRKSNAPTYATDQPDDSSDSIDRQAPDGVRFEDHSARAKDPQAENDALTKERDNEKKDRERASQALDPAHPPGLSPQASAAAAVAARIATDHPNALAPPGTEPSGSPPALVSVDLKSAVPVEPHSVHSGGQLAEKAGVPMDPRVAKSSGPGVSTPTSTGSQTNSVSESPDSSAQALIGTVGKPDPGIDTQTRSGGTAANVRGDRLGGIERMRVVKETPSGTSHSEKARTDSNSADASTQKPSGTFGVQPVDPIERGLGARQSGPATSPDQAPTVGLKAVQGVGAAVPDAVSKPTGAGEPPAPMSLQPVGSIDTLAHVIGMRVAAPLLAGVSGAAEGAGTSVIEDISTAAHVTGIAGVHVGHGASSGSTFGNGDNREGAGDEPDSADAPAALPPGGATGTGLQPVARHVSETAQSSNIATDLTTVVDRAHLVQQVAKHIETMRASARAGEMTLKLNPEHLGSMQLTVVSHGNGVSARIAVETAAAYRACDEAKDQLRASLESRGLEVTTLDITLNQQSSGEKSFDRQQQAAQHPPSYGVSRQTAHEPELVPAGTVAQPTVMHRNGSGRLDYRA